MFEFLNGTSPQKIFWDNLLQSGEYLSLFLFFLFKFFRVVFFPPSCFVRLRVNAVYSYSDIQTFQTVSLCSRSLSFQWSVFVLLLIPCLILSCHSNSSWWIYRKHLHRNTFIFVPSWWRNPCLKEISFLLTLLQSAKSQQADNVATTAFLEARLRKGLSVKTFSCLQLLAWALTSLSPWAEGRLFQKRGPCWPLTSL